MAVWAVVALDRSPSDFANQVTLLAVLLTAGGVAGAAPHRWILAGALPVTTLVIAHLLYAFGIGAPGYAAGEHCRPAGIQSRNRDRERASRTRRASGPKSTPDPLPRC
jgi:hypothetical protein